jgi:hypothetical protein
MSNTSGFGDFGKWVPGFEFLQSLTQPGAGASTGPSGWVAPTLSVEEIDKRVQELKAVLFWLEQNSAALKATIQALEVQKMTLTTLKGMNLSLQDMAQAFSVKTAAPSGQTAQAPSAPAAAQRAPSARKPRARARAQAKTQEAAPVVDPMQWWGALTQQFQQIANAAMTETQAAMAAKPDPTNHEPVRAVGAAPQSPPRRGAARKRAA